MREVRDKLFKKANIFNIKKSVKLMIVAVILTGSTFVNTLAPYVQKAFAATISNPTIVYQEGSPIVGMVDKGGVGALNISTPAGNDKAQVFVSNVNEAKLQDLTELSYRTFRDAGSAQQIAALNVTVDPWAGTFVYEPVYDSSSTVIDGVWQEWNAFSDTARWWRSGAPDTFLTWDQIIKGYETRNITSVMVGQGKGNPNLVSNIDYVTVNGETFDFAPIPPAVPTNLRFNETEPCGYITNVNSITPTWDAVVGAASYNYRATTPDGSEYGPTNVSGTSLTGPFGGEGLSTFSVQTVGSNGLTSAWSVPCGATYDATAPNVSLVSPSNNAVSNGSSLTQTWTSSSSDVDHYVYESYNNAEATSLRWRENFTTTSKTASNVGEGTFWWRVTAVDKAGNQSTTPLWKITIDNTVPATPKNPSMKVTSSGVNIPNNSFTNMPDVTASWEKGDTENVTFIYKSWHDGTAYTQTNPWTHPTSETSYSGTFNQGDGPAHFCVVAVDTAGNQSACSTPFTVTYDGLSPAVDVSSPTENQVINGYTVNIEGSATDTNFNYYYCYITNAAGSEVGTRDSLCQTAWAAGTPFRSAFTPTANGQNGGVIGSVSLPQTVADGAYTVHIVAKDKAGNTSEATQTFILDNEAPAVEITNVVRNDNGTYTISGTTESPTDTVSVSLDDNPLGPVTVDENGDWTVTSSVVGEGTHIVRATSTDTTGNTRNPAATSSFTVSPAAGNDNGTTTTGGGTTNSTAAFIANTPAATPQLFQTFAAVVTDDGLIAATPATENTPIEDGEVLGAEDTLAQNAANADGANKNFEILGMPWYWLPIALGALGTLWWLLAARRHRNNRS